MSYADKEYLEIKGTVVTFTDRAVLLEIGRHKRREWFPLSTLEHEPSFERGEDVVLHVDERFLEKACPWLTRTDYEVYDGD